MRISKVPWPSWIWNSRLEKLVKWSRSGIGQDSIRQTWYVRVEGFSALASLNSLQFHVVYFCSSPFSKTQKSKHCPRDIWHYKSILVSQDSNLCRCVMTRWHPIWVRPTRMKFKISNPLQMMNGSPKTWILFNPKIWGYLRTGTLLTVLNVVGHNIWSLFRIIYSSS